MTNNYRLGIVIPCFGRPARTRRIINNVLSQTINNWEAFIIGDGCPQFQNMINSLEVDYFIKTAEEKGNKLHCFNLDKNYGGFGHYITNYAIQNTKSKYFIFAGNDDILMPNHFEHYLSEIENTDLDLVYYKTLVAATNQIRNPELRGGGIGHSEIIVRTDVIRDIKHTMEYGHDWDFITQLLNKNIKSKKALSDVFTYVVTHIHHFGQDITCDNID